MFQVFNLSDLYDIIQTASEKICSNASMITPYMKYLLMLKLRSGRDRSQVKSQMQKSPPTSSSTPISQKAKRSSRK